MRDKKLTGFVIHHRPYQEKRAIYTLFCQEVGMIDGVAQQGLSPFCELALFATGKTALKTLKEPTLLTTISQMTAFVRYACLYVNELLYRLLAKEDCAAHLYWVYKQTLIGLQRLDYDDKTAIKRILRRFEWALFGQLGVASDHWVDGLGQAISPDGVYVFCLEQGFVPTTKPAILPTTIQPTTEQAITGQTIVKWRDFLYDKADENRAFLGDDELNQLGVVHKGLIDFLLEYKPLNSRKLWQDYVRLSNTKS